MLAFLSDSSRRLEGMHVESCAVSTLVISKFTLCEVDEAVSSGASAVATHDNVSASGAIASSRFHNGDSVASPTLVGPSDLNFWQI